MTLKCRCSWKSNGSKRRKYSLSKIAAFKDMHIKVSTPQILYCWIVFWKISFKRTHAKSQSSPSNRFLIDAYFPSSWKIARLRSTRVETELNPLRILFFYRAQHISNGNQNSSLDVKIVVINCLALALMLREFFFGAVICTISHITISSSTYPMTNGKLYYWRHVRATHEKLGWPFFRGFLFFLNSPKSDKKLSSPWGMDVLLWARALSSNSMAKK